MGAWGTDSFDNDTACDWSYDLEEADDLSLVRETLARVFEEGDEYLDSDAACEALAACEVIARLKGNWGQRNAHTETVDEWVESHAITPPADLVEQAVAAIGRILTPPSELLELWEESADGDAWHQAVEKLRARVRG